MTGETSACYDEIVSRVRLAQTVEDLNDLMAFYKTRINVMRHSGDKKLQGTAICIINAFTYYKDQFQNKGRNQRHFMHE